MSEHGTPFPLEQGDDIGRFLLESFTPLAQRIEIAGSIRRRLPIVGDVDLVIETARQPEILAHIRRWGKIITSDDDTAQNTIAVLARDVQLDIFFATPATSDLAGDVPGNFATLFLCRTGSMEHNIQFAARAKRRGTPWNPYRGISDGKGGFLCCETEEQLYAALDLPWLDPTRRDSLHA